MHELAHLAWRSYPATGLMAWGLWFVLRGVRRCRAAWPRPASGLMQPLGWMRGFRLTVVGLALAGVGAAWLWQIGWLLAVALIVGFGETLESSLDIDAFSREQGTGDR
ncbi:MAG TPA: hypothetical protein VKV26_07450 [Dehalococcoidia bacterium]|nr:hypothetical protein [Dehalococcoidia bacterium]